MKIGSCLNLLANDEDHVGARFIPELKRLGYDYAELPVAQFMELDDAAFSAMESQLRGSGVPCEACNNFVPPTVRVTGESVSLEKVKDYLKAAVERIVRLGAAVVVYGSAGSRIVDEGFSHDRATEQIAEFLAMAADMLAPFGVTVAIECLNQTECNIIGSLDEGHRLAQKVALPNVCLLTDYYHMEMEDEPVGEIGRLHGLGARFVHAHISDKRTKRGFPLDGGQVAPFAEALRAIGYDARVSVEGFTQNMEEESAISIKILRDAFR